MVLFCQLELATQYRFWLSQHAFLPGRKMGHVNILASEDGDLLSCLDQLHRTIYGEANPSLQPPPVLNHLNIAGARSSNLI